MARDRGAGPSHRKNSDASSRAKAVMKAFRSAKGFAPKFMSSCGIFPEVSESASDRLHSIVHELATGQLGQGRHLRALKKRLRELSSLNRLKRGRTHSVRADLVDGIGTELTAILASEATAAYLFGLSVGLTVRSLPDRFGR